MAQHRASYRNHELEIEKLNSKFNINTLGTDEQKQLSDRIIDHENRMSNHEIQVNNLEDKRDALELRLRDLEIMRDQDIFGEAETHVDPLRPFNYDWDAEQLALMIARERGEYFAHDVHRYKREMMKIIMGMDSRVR